MTPELSTIIARAYDAPLQEARWEIVLDQMAGGLGAQAAALLLRENSGPVYGVNKVSEAYRRVLAEEGDYYIRELAQHEAEDWLRVSRLAEGELLFDDEMGPDVSVLDQRPDYVYLREYAGIRRRIGFRLNHNPGFFDAITLGFPSALDVIPRERSIALSALIPHLARAMELTRAFGLLRQKYRAALAAIDHFGLGIAFALPTGEIILQNTEAARQFEDGDALFLTAQSRPAARDPVLSGQIADAIKVASAIASGQGRLEAGVFQVPKTSCSGAIVLEIAPIADADGEIDRNLRGAILTMIDPDALPDFDIPRFSRLFGLSAAETEVCALLAVGDTSATIAEKRSTSFNTARNQVNAVLAKTGSANRSQLLRKIARTVPPIS